MASVRQIAGHYAVRVALVLAGWGIKALANKIKAAAHHRKGRCAAVAPHSRKPSMRFMRNPAREYQPSNPKWLVEAAAWKPHTISPELLPQCPALTAFKGSVAAGAFSMEFGTQQCLEQLFALDPTFTYLNHGSYGANYRLASEVQAWWRQQMEQEPVRFMETVGMAGLVRAVADVAAFISADWQDVVPVANATSAINAVVNSINLQRGDVLLITNTTYPAVRSTFAHAAAAAGARLLDLTLSLEDLLDEDQLVSCYAAAIKAAGRRLQLVVLDHVTSFPPAIMPVKRICDLCRGAGVPVLVDGAHAIGALPDLDVPSMGCEYYTTNLHKWMCAPKGAALLWVHPSKQASVHPLVVSHGHGLGFRAEFLWQGTSDFTPWLATTACITVMEALGPAEVAKYSHSLVKQATQLLQQAWSTKIAIGIAQNGNTAGMVAVQLPWPLRFSSTGSAAGSGSSNGIARGLTVSSVTVNGMSSDSSNVAGAATAVQHSSSRPPNAADAAALNKLLRDQHRIEVPVVCVGGMLWVRISAQIYNRLQDYQKLIDVILGMAVSA